MESCRARQWVEEVSAPAIVFKPATEMARETAQLQRQILEGAGVDFRIVEHGIHGSSMLVDARTNQDMSAVRSEVIEWLGSRHSGAGQGE